MKKPQFPTKDGVMWEPQGLFWAQFCAIHGARRAAEECRKMNEWLLRKPGQWKTANGMPRFMNDWMARGNPRGSTNGKIQPQRRETRNDLFLKEALASLDEAPEDAGGQSQHPYPIQ